MTPRLQSFSHAAAFLGVLLVLAALAPWVNDLGLVDKYTHEILLDIGLNIILAVSLNLILGMTGQFSLGHAGFLAAGAYMATLIAGRWFEPLLHLYYSGLHLSMINAMYLVMLTGMLAGMAVAALLGLLVGLPTLRLRGDYLAIATLGFGEILAVLLTNTPYLGGATGFSIDSLRRLDWLTEVPEANPLVGPVSTYLDNMTYTVGFFWVYAAAALTILIVRNIKYATSGRALLAIREDPIASESVGIPTTRYKVTAFILGAALAGLAGGLLSHHKTLMNPESFRFQRSIEIVAMVILGGQGSITGSILAAVGLTILPEFLRSVNGSLARHGIPIDFDIEKWRMVLYSLAIILVMLFRPQGLFGRYELPDLLRFLTGRGRNRKSTGPAQQPNGPAVGVTDLQPPSSNCASQASLLLSISHLGMSFGGLRAVDGFDLTLAPGELVGLIGPNGAGKTTVFNLLTGVYTPTDGTIVFQDRSIVGLAPHTISQYGIARTFQNIRLFGNLRVLDNLQIAQHVHHKQGIPAAILRTPAFFAEEAESRRVAFELLRLFHLQHLAGEQSSALSYGDQRRLEIARALATRPKLLLLDEPAAGMNPTEKRQLMDLIHAIRDHFHLTILLIEHDMQVVMGICQRILVLDYGKTIAAGAPAEIRKNPAVIEAYLGASAKHG